MLFRKLVVGAIVALAACVCLPASAAKPDVQSMAYEIVSDGQSDQGWCLVKVTVVTDGKKDAADMRDYDSALWRLLSVPECCKGYDRAVAEAKVVYQQYVNRQ